MIEQQILLDYTKEKFVRVMFGTAEERGQKE